MKTLQAGVFARDLNPQTREWLKGRSGVLEAH